MTAVLLVGVGRSPGKSALAVALGKRLQREGRSVGYVQPAFSGASGGAEADAAFIGRTLGLKEPLTQLAPSCGALPVAKEQAAGLQDHIAAALATVAAGKDVVLVEAPGSLGDPAADSAITLLADALDAKIIAVVRYEQGLDGAAVASRLNRLKARIAGVVVNSAPRKLLPVLGPVGQTLSQRGFPFLGFLPEDRRLYGFSIAEIASHLNASFLTGQDKAGGLIENILLQANPADPLSAYVDQKPNRMVIVRVDRPDLQLASMDTGPRCLILTGTGQELHGVINRAEDEGVPLLRVPINTQETIAALDGLLDGVRFRHDEKVARVLELVDQHLDLAPVLATLAPAAETAGTV